MIEFNNKIIIMFFVGVVIVLGLGYVMNSNGMFSGYATSSCSDTDGGKNYYLYGIVIKGTTTRVDSCLNATRLREFYCNNAGKIASVNYVCTLPYMCAGGQCIATTTTTTFTSSTTNLLPDGNLCKCSTNGLVNSAPKIPTKSSGPDISLG